MALNAIIGAATGALLSKAMGGGGSMPESRLEKVLRQAKLRRINKFAPFMFSFISQALQANPAGFNQKAYGQAKKRASSGRAQVQAEAQRKLGPISFANDNAASDDRMLQFFQRLGELAPAENIGFLQGVMNEGVAGEIGSMQTQAMGRRSAETELFMAMLGKALSSIDFSKVFGNA